MGKSRSHHSLVKDNRHISYTTFRNSLKSDLDGVVEDPNMYSSHSLRAGGATKAANSGLNDRLIQRHGHMIALLTSWKFLNRLVTYQPVLPKLCSLTTAVCFSLQGAGRISNKQEFFLIDCVMSTASYPGANNVLKIATLQCFI
jgi:hypothetical protein